MALFCLYDSKETVCAARLSHVCTSTVNTFRLDIVEASWQSIAKVEVFFIFFTGEEYLGSPHRHHVTPFSPNQFRQHVTSRNLTSKPQAHGSSSSNNLDQPLARSPPACLDRPPWPATSPSASRRSGSCASTTPSASPRTRASPSCRASSVRDSLSLWPAVSIGTLLANQAGNSLLGLCRLQRRRMRRHREPAAQVHGRPAAAPRAPEYNQLPPLPYEEIRHQSREKKVRVSWFLPSLETGPSGHERPCTGLGGGGEKADDERDEGEEKENRRASESSTTGWEGLHSRRWFTGFYMILYNTRPRKAGCRRIGGNVRCKRSDDGTMAHPHTNLPKRLPAG